MDFFSTYISGNAIKYASEVLASGRISEGKKNEEFEMALRRYLNTNYLFTTNSGTSALHLALKLAKIGPGSRVVIPAQTFIATALAVAHCGAEVIFCDIDLKTGNISTTALEELLQNYLVHGRTISAVITVDWGGYPCDYDEINRLAYQYNFKVIDDAAHAFGARYKGVRLGNCADFTTFSFQAIKTLTTGDGGLVTCKHLFLETEGKRLRWFGIDRQKDLPDELGERVYTLDYNNVGGYKYHMNDIAAAIGLGNLEKIHDVLNHNEHLARIYTLELGNVPGLNLLDKNPDNLSSNWLFTVLVVNRPDFIKKMSDNFIPVSVVHRGIHKHPLFRNLRQLPNQEFWDRNQISLPIHYKISESDVYRICKVIKNGW